MSSSNGFGVYRNRGSMDNYNVWEICKATRGVVADDYWWLAKDGDRYEDFHIRARFEKNN